MKMSKPGLVGDNKPVNCRWAMFALLALLPDGRKMIFQPRYHFAMEAPGTSLNPSQ